MMFSIEVFGFSIVEDKKYNQIDSLITNTEIEKFVNEICNPIYDFKLNLFEDTSSWVSENIQYEKNLADSLRISPIIKLDIDNNNYTDLIVLGIMSGDYTVLVIYCSSDFEYRIEKLSINMIGFPKIQMIEGKNVIDYYYVNYTNKMIPKLGKKQLIYKFGSLIELPEQLNTYRLNNIEVVSSGMLGSCHKEITIDEIRIKNYSIKRRCYLSKIAPNQFNFLQGILSNVDIENLEIQDSRYSCTGGGTDLIIYYNEGKKKLFSFDCDRLQLGHYGLIKLYEESLKLQGKKWKKKKCN